MAGESRFVARPTFCRLGEAQDTLEICLSCHCDHQEEETDLRETEPLFLGRPVAVVAKTLVTPVYYQQVEAKSVVVEELSIHFADQYSERNL